MAFEVGLWLDVGLSLDAGLVLEVKMVLEMGGCGVEFEWLVLVLGLW